MNYFIETIQFSQIVVLYWLAAPASFRLMHQSYLNKNPAWSVATPQFSGTAPRYPAVLAYLLGLAWLAKFSYDTVTGQDGGDTTAALLWPMLLWLVLELAVAGIEYMRLYRAIPLPAKRRASIAPRALADYAHPLWCYAGATLVLCLAALYLAAWAQGRVALDLMAWRLAGLVLGATLWAVALRYTVRRKKQAIDDAFGPAYRVAEVRATIACLYLFAAVGAARAMEEISSDNWLGHGLLLALASLTLQALVVFWMTFNLSTRKQHAH